jgi:hypothetical protein
MMSENRNWIHLTVSLFLISGCASERSINEKNRNQPYAIPVSKSPPRDSELPLFAQFRTLSSAELTRAYGLMRGPQRRKADPGLNSAQKNFELYRDDLLKIALERATEVEEVVNLLLDSGANPDSVDNDTLDEALEHHLNKVVDIIRSRQKPSWR